MKRIAVRLDDDRYSKLVKIQGLLERLQGLNPAGTHPRFTISDAVRYLIDVGYPLIIKGAQDLIEKSRR